jgi:penicillin-binding protein 1C
MTGRVRGSKGPRVQGFLNVGFAIKDPRTLGPCLLLALLLVAGAPVGARHAVPLRYDEVRDTYCPSDVRLLDRHGAVLHELRIDHTRRRLAWTPLAAVSPALTAAVLDCEDRRFFSHGGVDWRAVAAAVWQRLRAGPPRGASTLSMQVAALLDPDLRRGGARTLAEKWRQMRAAWALERAWTKEQILEAYLNLVTFRGELQGIGAAAQVLFGKAPHGLTTAESVVLAALIRSPNADRAALTRRALGARAAGPLSAQAWRFRESAPGALPSASSDQRTRRPRPSELAAAIERAIAVPRGSGPRVALAPHAARRLLPQNGQTPCTDTPSTLDAATQRVAAASLRRQLLAIRDRSARDAAVLVAENATGDVLAYVASSGDLSRARHVDGIQAHRQAGSTLKPFLYARALERRLLTAASLLDDAPLEIPVGRGLFRPRNYDETFRGLVSLRTALAGSLNVPAVRTLMLVGPDDFADQLRQFGFGGVAQPGEYYGPSLALGSADVTLWELVTAYRTLANSGARTPLRLERGAPSPPGADRGERTATDPAQPPIPGGDGAPPSREQAAFIVADILADRDARSVTFGLESPLATRFWTAVKTGTSTDMRDNWCIGFSRRYTVGVWVGNFSGEPMRDVSGMSGAAPIWSDVMNWLHRDLPSDQPTPPPGVRRVTTGFADDAEPARDEWFLSGTEPLHAAPVRARSPQIVAPTDGSVIAIDPDIPAARQRVAFDADAAGDAARWMLDGRDLGPAAAPVLWQPVRGAHTLQLVDAAARALATVRFEVRGSAGGATPPT